MTVRFVLAAVTLVLPAAAGAQLREADLHAFLQSAYAEARADSPEMTYTAAFADLNGDGRDEALVMPHAGSFCGSGGCGLYIYTPEGGTWRQIDDLTIVGEPVLMLATSRNGWRDLGLVVRDGGMDRPYQVRLRFNGGSYGGSATRVGRGSRLDGRVLIGEGMPSRRLFQ